MLGLKRSHAKLRAELRRRRFVQAYLTGPDGVRGNATASAIAAGFTGRSRQSATIRGFELLHQSATERQIARHLDRLGATTDRLLTELAAVAFARLSDVVEWDAGGLRVVRDSRLLDEATLAAVQEVEQEDTPDGGTRLKRVRLYDKLRALELLLKAKRALGDDVPREFTLVIGRAGQVTVRAAGEPDDGKISTPSPEGETDLPARRLSP